MGFLVRLFTTENFSELLSSKVQGYTSLDSTTVEFFLWEAFSPMCFSSELPSLKFSQNQKGVYIVWLQRCLWPEEKGLFQYDKKKLIMAIPQWREEMYLSIRSLKRWEMIIVCLFLVLFSGKKDMCDLTARNPLTSRGCNITVYMVFHLSPFSEQNKIS